MSNDVESKQERLLCEQSLAFFGTIVASISHELNNVVSIIDQNAGLLEDYLVGLESGSELPQEKIKRITETVQHQTRRGLHIIRRLNKFAHSADLPITEFDINETLESFCIIYTRLTELKKVTLEFIPHDSRLTIANNPFLLQQCMFKILSAILKQSSKGDVVKVSLQIKHDSIIISMEGSTKNVEPMSPEEIVDNFLLQRLKGTITVKNSPDDSMVIDLILPKKISTV